MSDFLVSTVNYFLFLGLSLSPLPMTLLLLGLAAQLHLSITADSRMVLEAS